MVVIDKVDYVEKLQVVIKENGFEQMKKDVTDTENGRLGRMLMDLEKKGEMIRSERLKLMDNIG